MKKTFLIFAALIVAISTQAQEISEKKGTMFTLAGMVRDKLTSAQLIGAEIRLFDQQDSLIAKGEAHTRNWDYSRGAEVETARYEIEFKKSEIQRVGTFRMRIAAEGHDTLWTDVNLRDVGRRELMRDLGTHYLTKTRTVNLDEVTVTATKVKFYHRGDNRLMLDNLGAYTVRNIEVLEFLMEKC